MKWGMNCFLRRPGYPGGARGFASPVCTGFAFIVKSNLFSHGWIEDVKAAEALFAAFIRTG